MVKLCEQSNLEKNRGRNKGYSREVRQKLKMKKSIIEKISYGCSLRALLRFGCVRLVKRASGARIPLRLPRQKARCSWRQVLAGVLFSHNPDAKMPMASCTKIMTALVAIESGELDKTVEVRPEACGVEGSSVYLRPKEKLTLKELLYGLMLQSGNDCAVAIAYELAGGSGKFCRYDEQPRQRAGSKQHQFCDAQRTSRRQSLYYGLRPRTDCLSGAFKRYFQRDSIHQKRKNFQRGL